MPKKNTRKLKSDISSLLNNKAPANTFMVFTMHTVLSTLSKSCFRSGRLQAQHSGSQACACQHATLLLTQQFLRHLHQAEGTSSLQWAMERCRLLMLSWEIHMKDPNHAAVFRISNGIYISKYVPSISRSHDILLIAFDECLNWHVHCWQRISILFYWGPYLHINSTYFCLKTRPSASLVPQDSLLWIHLHILRELECWGQLLEGHFPFWCYYLQILSP